MARVIITAQVEDAERWKKNFRTHKKLFRQYSAKVVHYTAADGEVGILWRVKDADKMLAMIQDPETIEAMESDGVKRDTVKVYVLDEKIELLQLFCLL